MSNMENKLENLLNSKTQIDVPAGLESRIMAKVTAERLKENKPFLFFIKKNYYAFASVLSVMIVLGAAVNTANHKPVVLSKAMENEMLQNAAEADYYAAAANELSQIDKDIKLDKELEKMDDYQIYMNTFGSST